MSYPIDEIEKDLKDACAEMSWRNKQEGMERVLSALCWWLESKGATPESLTISAIRNEFMFNNESTDALEHVLNETDCVSVSDLLERWAKLEKLESEWSKE